MEDEPVRHLERHLGQVLVRAMDGIARLEAGHLLPAAGRDLLAQRARRQPIAGEGEVRGQGQHAHGPAHERARAAEQIGDAGVGRVLRAVHGARFPERIARVDVLHAQETPHASAGVAESRFAAGADGVAGGLVHGEGEGQGPHRAVGQAQPIEHGLVVRGAEESDQGAGRARRDQLQVRLLARVERDLGKGLRAMAQALDLVRGDETVDERAAVRFNQPGHG